MRAPRQERESAAFHAVPDMRIGTERTRAATDDAGLQAQTTLGAGRVFYLFDAGGPPARPLARFTDEADARSAVAAFERLGRRATLMSRDESRDRPRPSFWRLEHASPAAAAVARSGGGSAERGASGRHPGAPRRRRPARRARPRRRPGAGRRLRRRRRLLRPLRLPDHGRPALRGRARAATSPSSSSTSLAPGGSSPRPSLTLVVTDVAAYHLLNVVRAREAVADSIWASLFAANVHFAQEGGDYFARAQPASPVQHYWSLAVEEQFYVVWPGVLALVLCRRRPAPPAAAARPARTRGDAAAARRGRRGRGRRRSPGRSTPRAPRTGRRVLLDPRARVGARARRRARARRAGAGTLASAGAARPGLAGARPRSPAPRSRSRAGRRSPATRRSSPRRARRS